MVYLKFTKMADFSVLRKKKGRGERKRGGGREREGGRKWQLCELANTVIVVIISQHIHTAKHQFKHSTT
jgi:hypothetical protein